MPCRSIPNDVRETIAARSGGICELCGRRRATNVHHRLRAGQQGGEHAANGLHVCGSGTTGCHGAIHRRPQRAYANGWMVRDAVSPATMPARLMTGHGERYVHLTDDGGMLEPDWTALAVYCGVRDADPSR